MITTPKHLLVAGGFAIAGLLGPVMAEESAAARAEYPGGFTRPPSEGKNYDTWKGAKGPDVGITRVDPKRLPSRVDNSKRPEFPPVYKQRWGACGQFASVASIFTYEMNVLNATKPTATRTDFPLTFPGI